jgi:3-methyladenine DNA glycosylase AlkD
MKKSAPPPDCDAIVAKLKKLGSQKGLDSMARFAIVTDKAFGISVEQIRKVAKELGQNHALAQDLWDAEWYEARMLAAFVDDPAEVTPKQMNAWIADFDNWAICDTCCFHLFDKTAHAWKRISPWSKLKPEIEKRAAFATLWGLSVHDKAATDEQFIDALEIIENSATDERNFVRKAVNMALRAIGKRNAALHSAALSVAERLAASDDPTSRWNGKDALRELRSASVLSRLAKKAKKS